jgi:hypothetical protein
MLAYFINFIPCSLMYVLKLTLIYAIYRNCKSAQHNVTVRQKDENENQKTKMELTAIMRKMKNSQ